MTIHAPIGNAYVAEPVPADGPAWARIREGARPMPEPRPAPVVGAKVRAHTTTPAAVAVVVEVTAIDGENELGWFVYGYRAHRGARPRQTMFPRLYFVPKEQSR